MKIFGVRAWVGEKRERERERERENEIGRERENEIGRDIREKEHNLALGRFFLLFRGFAAVL